MNSVCMSNSIEKVDKGIMYQSNLLKGSAKLSQQTALYIACMQKFSENFRLGAKLIFPHPVTHRN